ncbi:PTS sugar transporter subunit IIC [Lentilactobacillus sp. Marseille-Q4993]|uniref:PTS sugar transporter subunit IIC n=1 Tax=Lentilactobacillus sp. Marseille-Q4993 TaxID=3039492 RepID=UPI0024BCE3EE|nr:PTS sugar transporter subunit IIC [Lentilactobacillus sp. Marseille-Q4993]
MTGSTIVLTIGLAFIAGMAGILDEWQVYQPLVVCSLMGLVFGDLQTGIMFGATLQMIVIGWMNIGSAVSPDITLAAVISGLFVAGPSQLTIEQGVIVALVFGVIGQYLNIGTRKQVLKVVHRADQYVAVGDISGVGRSHLKALSLQGLRVAVPTAIAMAFMNNSTKEVFDAIPPQVNSGLKVGVSLIALVGFSIIINMFATRHNWGWLFLGVGTTILLRVNFMIMVLIGLIFAIAWVVISNHQEAKESSSDDDFDDLDDL